ncbi:type II toxin-antitoxin system mRNA interferase toxin, RelE/StbE family [Candidatus Azambacteria bacterium]|nr:type II toxin-antitoxin system mRNA interferase toxin, RelE/StbE family [Candidatus Azambacteria bacterium]
MRIVFHKNFEKRYQKLAEVMKLKIKERNILFEQDPYHPILNNHSLTSQYTGYRIINITGDIRIIYKLLDNEVALFSEIGSHSLLYK